MSEKNPPSITPQGTAPRRVSGSAAGKDSAADKSVRTPDSTGINDETSPKATRTTAAALPKPASLPKPVSVSKPAPGPDPLPKPTPSMAAAPGARSSVTTPVADDGSPRRVRLAIAQVDPWSVMKLSFLLAVAAGIMLVVAAAVVWQALDGLNVFTEIDTMIVTFSDSDKYSILEAVSFRRTISLATVIGVIDIVLLTALATLGAFLYNIVAALVGGLHLTFTDD